MCDVAIVEDEELERRALRSILGKQLDGVNIVGEARNGAEAMKLIGQKSIDLILVDINIPKPNGLEIIQSIRDRGLKTKVIILTAYDYFEMMQRAISLKADHYLLKPVRTEQLLDVVNKCVCEIEASRSSDKIADEIRSFVEKRSYRECLSIVRNHVESIYARKTEAPRQGLLDFSALIIELCEDEGIALPDEMQLQIEGLPKDKLDGRSRSRMMEFFTEIVTAIFDESESQFGRAPERMQNVLNYIERNLGQDITLEDAATRANVSPCYFSRLFSKTMGKTFVAYVNQRRIERAKEMLGQSNEPVMNISLDLSFSDVNYFCKVFKKEVGVSPTEFRKTYSH